MRSALALTLVVAVAAVSVTADKCLSICESKEIWGFDKNTQLCQCEDGIGPNRTGPNVCVCQMCYKKEGKNVVAYGYNAEGVCPWGTDCSACDLKVSSSSSSGSGSLSAGLDSNASNKTDAGSASQSGMGNIAPDKGFELSDLQTWQIALLICSLTLIVAVAMVAIVAWHCKRRKRMQNEAEIPELGEKTPQYQTYWKAHAEPRPEQNETTLSDVTSPTANTLSRSFVAQPLSELSSSRGLAQQRNLSSSQLSNHNQSFLSESSNNPFGSRRRQDNSTIDL